MEYHTHSDIKWNSIVTARLEWVYLVIMMYREKTDILELWHDHLSSDLLLFIDAALYWGWVKPSSIRVFCFTEDRECWSNPVRIPTSIYLFEVKKHNGGRMNNPWIVLMVSRDHEPPRLPPPPHNQIERDQAGLNWDIPSKKGPEQCLRECYYNTWDTCRYVTVCHQLLRE